MKKEEAIKGLKRLSEIFSSYKPNEEMFDMAIRALEQSDMTTRASEQPEEPMWNPIEKERAPSGIDLLVTVVDDSGDSPYTEVVPAWKTLGNEWISNNDCIAGKVTAWALYPDPYTETNQ